jgi:Zn-dependent M28 family amino/carboxypeptidase
VGRVADANLIGVVRGTDSLLRREAVVVGAHFDHMGVGPAVAGDSVYNGADDDASGVAAMLVAARALAQSPPRRTVVVLLTSGEEQGVLGTQWYLAHPAFPLSQTVADLQVEMVGRPDSLAGGAGRLWLTGYERSTMGERFAGARLNVVPDARPQFKFFERSDNIVFALKGIPAHTLSSFGRDRTETPPLMLRSFPIGEGVCWIRNSATASRAISAIRTTPSRSVSGSSIANSSPPNRATKSPGLLQQDCRAAATCLRHMSPAWCP